MHDHRTRTRQRLIESSLVAHLAALVLLGGCLSKKDTDRTPPVVASVDGTPIFADEFSRALKRIALDSDQGLPSVETLRLQKRALLKDLINHKLLLRAADEAKVVVDIDNVEAAFRATRRGWKERRNADDCPGCVFEQQLTAKNLTVTEFKNNLRESLLIRKYFRERVFARIAVTDAEIAAYTEANPEISAAPEKVRARHIFVSTEEEAKEVERQLRSGLSFEDAAMKYSQGPQAETGGDLGWFRRGVMPSLFDEVCFSLTPGKTSKPVASPRGYHIFRVEERTEPRDKPFERVSEEVEALLRRDKERQAEAETIAHLREQAQIETAEKVLAEVR